MSRLRILFIGDVVGATGRCMFQKHISSIKTKYKIDGVVVNGENSAHGRGITSRIVRFFKHNGVDVITSGNHIWRYKEIYSYLEQNNDLLRPANYPSEDPGVGITTFNCGGNTVAVINVQGRVFMRDHIACPFRTVDSLLTYLRDKTNLIFIDFHAETTSEKMAMAHYTDGRVSAIIGTHTHVQTADERVLPGGTAFISDIGMVGSFNAMLGMQKEQIIRNFLTQMPVKFEVANSEPIALFGAWVEVDAQTGKAVDIQRVKIIDQELHVAKEDE